MKFLSILLLLCTCAASAQQADSAAHHTLVIADQLKWSAGALPNLEMAVVSGDPKGTGPFVLRLRAIGDQRVPAHWHPTDEHVTAIKAGFSIGVGENFSQQQLRPMKAGDYIELAKETRHFAWMKKGAEVQVHGQGPFVINWVNPAEVAAMKKDLQADSASERTKMKQEQDKR
ncbi:MAG: cupin domain-containing protein [Acidobacteriales bacterium]|nr:cupin domain-containing protein [Terriglobales bacterium]